MTILIPGTRWETSGGWVPESNGYRGLMACGDAMPGSGACTRFFPWLPSRNRHADRIAAAEALRALIAAHNFVPGETLNIIAHSHGANVVLAASHLGLARPIDTFIALNKPTLTGKAYRPGQNQGRFFNISATRDWIQILGARLFSRWTRDRHAINHCVDTRASSLRPHAALVWDDEVREQWWQWFQRQ